MDCIDLKAWAAELGFCDAALCDAAPFYEQKTQVMHQPPLSERKQLKYDPSKENANTKSIEVLLWPYKPYKPKDGRAVFIDSYYAASNAAYHAAQALEAKLRQLGRYARANVSYPAKEAAVRAGLGIVGDHSLFIHPIYGTRVVIILMETDISVETATTTVRKECLHCGKCAHVCPTGAIDQQGMSHPEKCLRNFMLEGIVVPEEIRGLMGRKMLGCDLCQQVCPMQHSRTECSSVDEWTLDVFLSANDAVFSSSVKRLQASIGRNTARPQRIRAQAALLCGNIGDFSDLPVLKSWLNSDFEAVREHAAWSISQIENREGLTEDSNDAGLDQSSQTGYNI